MKSKPSVMFKTEYPRMQRFTAIAMGSKCSLTNYKLHLRSTVRFIILYNCILLAMIPIQPSVATMFRSFSCASYTASSLHFRSCQ
jgi:hypothetical protein